MSGMLSPSEIQSLFSGLDLSRPGCRATGQLASGNSAQADQFTLPLSLEPDDQAELNNRLSALVERWKLTWTETPSRRWSVAKVSCQATRLRDFIAAHATFRRFQVIEADSDFVHWVTVDDSLAESHLDAILGAADIQPCTHPRRIWGPLEHQLTSRLVQNVSDSLFPPLESNLTWKITGVDSPEDWIAAAPVFLSCELVQFDIELNCSGSLGRLHLGIPRILAERSLKSGQPQSMTSHLSSGVSEGSAMLRATLTPTMLSPVEFSQLQVGDVLLTGLDAEATCQLSVNGQSEYLATIGSHQGHKAVRLVAKTESLRSHLS